MTVRLNNTVLISNQLKSEGEFTLRIDFPKEAFYPPESGLANVLEIQFLADIDCNQYANAQILLTIHNSSYLHFEYALAPLVLDLGLFPAPLYHDQSVVPSQIHFVLSDELSKPELDAALSIAAMLGNVSRNNLPLTISGTSDLSDTISSQSHLIVIGTPDSNALISQLALPVATHVREMELHSKMPSVVKPDQSFIVSITVKNTLKESRSPIVEEHLPQGAEIIDCIDNCSLQSPGNYRWQPGLLAPDQEVSFEFTVQLDPNVFSLGSQFEHMASLLDDTGNTINVDTLAAQVDPGADADQLALTIESPAQKETNFFMKDGQAVPEGDGIIQEIASPWAASKAVIVVTGLSDDAVTNASRALTTKPQFPGMRGKVAFVESTTTLDEAFVTGEDFTFASLGYQDVSATYFQDILQVNFSVPPGWLVEDEATLMLHYSYSEAMTTMFSTLEIGLSNLPIKSVLLDNKETSDDLWESVDLQNDRIKMGKNILSFRLIGDYPKCISNQILQSFWISLLADSYLHLPHSTIATDYNLANFPYLFTSRSDLSDIILALPEDVTSEQLNHIVLLASYLGYSSSGDRPRLQVAIGGDPQSTQLEGYNIIAYGLPTNNPYISAANEDLPQPFKPGTNEIVQSNDNVVFRLPEGFDLGYIQLLPSPWNKDKALMVITGSTELGVTWAVNALLNDNLNYKLNGNLAILVKEDDIRTADTRSTLKPGDNPTTIAPELTPTTALSPSTAPTPLPSEVVSNARSLWLWALLIFCAIVIAIVLLLRIQKK